MKNYSTSSVSKRNRFSLKFIGLLLLFLVVSVSEGWGQSYLGLDGGFEGSATIDNTGTTGPLASKWTKANASLSIVIESGTIRSGGNSLRINNSSTSGYRLWSPLISTSSTTSSITLQYWRFVANTTNCNENQDGLYTSSETLNSGYGTGTAGAWTKVTYTKSSSTYSAVSGIVMARKKGSGGDMFLDDMCIYAGAADATAPNAPTLPVIGTPTTSSLNVAWTAASGGVDNGGYLVVRGTSDPTTAPNLNGIYAVNNTIGGGTVIYRGTGTSFNDTGLSPNTLYYYRIYTYDKAYNYSSALTGSGTTTSSGSTPPALTADATSNTVDNNIDITFPEDATWRGFVSAVKVGGTALTPTTDYVLSDGNLQLKPSGGNTLLRTAGSKTVTVEATGYTVATVTQAINAGVANKLAMGTQPTTPASNGAVLATQPTVYIQDQYGNATTSTANITATVGAGAWTLGGTIIKAGVAGTATYTDLTATAATAVTGATISFAGDGLTGTTSAGFNIPTPPPTITVTSLDGFGSITVNTTSGELSYPVSAEHLTENLVITPPVGFEISTTSGSGFVANPSTLTLTQAGGTINTTTIYVRFNPATVQAYSTTITHTSAGATTQNVAVSGTATAAAAPTTSTATDITNSSFTANWGTVSGANGYKLDVSTSATFGTMTTATLNEGFESGMPTSGYSSGTYSLTTGSWDLTNILQGTNPNYHSGIRSCQIQGSGSPTAKIITPSLNKISSVSFWCAPGSSNTTLTISKDVQGSITLLSTITLTGNSAFTQYSLNNATINESSTDNVKLIFSNTGTKVAYLDDISIDYSTGTPSFLSGYNDLSVGGTSQSVTGLTANTTYYYRVRSTGGGATSANSNTTTVLTAPSAPTAAEETNNTATGFTATWALPTGGATSYALDVSENIGFSSFVSGYENLAVTGTSQVVSGLSPNTTYYYRVKAINATATATSGTITAATNNSIAVTGTVNVSTLPVCSTCDVVVAAGATLTVNENRTFNTMTVNPTGKLTNTASTLTLATLNLNSDATGTGTFVDNGTSIITAAHVQQYLTTGRNWYVSIPVTAADTTALSTSNAVKYWDEPTGLWKSPTVLALDVRKGYIAAGTKSTGVITFDGELNNGNVTFNATRTEGVYKEGFNLIGNPYPSYVNWESATKTRVGTSIWYRTKNSGGTYVFDTFNGVGTNNNQGGAVTGMIPPMQAVWVRVDVAQTTGSVLFTNAMRAHESGTNKLKAPAVNNPLQILRLQVSNVENSDEAIIVFNDNASNALDTYDSPKMTNSNNAIPEIYSLIGSDELVINGMNSYSSTTEIPVGFRTGATNNFSIKATEVSNFEDGTQIILKDSELTTETDITNGTPYTFASDAVSTPNRFSIIFRNSSITTGLDHNQSNDKSISVYRNSNSHIVVNCSSDIVGNGNVSVYNAIGQKLTYKAINSTSTVLEQSYTAGVYFVSVVANGKTITRKVIVD